MEIGTKVKINGRKGEVKDIEDRKPKIYVVWLTGGRIVRITKRQIESA